jgi:acyl-CoA synthetase (NDP forming)
VTQSGAAGPPGETPNPGAAGPSGVAGPSDAAGPSGAARSIDLRPLFAPRSIAVVGASPRSGIALTVRDNLRVLESAVPCHFVNPKYDELLGQPCFPSLDALPEVPDTVVVALNPLRSAMVAADAARLGVPSLLIPGGGVVEGGDPARHMQAEVRRIAIDAGIALLGPNCMGIVDYTTNTATYIGDVNPWQARGGVAGIAQSGSVTDAFIHASGTRIGWSRIVSCGAEVVLDVCDYLAYCLDDPSTHAVVLFVEGFKRPERFLALADHALAIGKPIALVKVGRSAQAQVAALAHSGSLAGEERVFDAAVEAAGVIRCADLDELLETAELLAGCHRLERGTGLGRTGVVTVSTGEASLIADLAPITGIDLPTVPEATRERILEDLPTMGYVGNPLDPWGAAEADVAYRACLEAFATSGAYDVLAVVHDFPYRSLPSEVEVAGTVAAALVEATRDRPHLLPVFVSLTSGEPTPEILDAMRDAGGVPVLRGAQEAFRAIAHRAWWDRRRTARLVDGPRRPGWPAMAIERVAYGLDPAHGGAGAEVDETEPAAHAAAGLGPPVLEGLPERESLDLLGAAGLPVTPAIAAADPDAAVAAADALGYPVVVKLDATGLAHKSDVGGVRLGLADAATVRSATSELLALGPARGGGAAHARAGGGTGAGAGGREGRRGLVVRGVLVEPMAAPGVELIAGVRRDPLYGPAVLVGLGGILAEVLDDVAIGLAPLGPSDAAAMLDRLRGAAILHGVRGAPPVDRHALVELLVGLGRLAAERPDILEIDLNPVIASPDGVVAVDGLVVLETRP